MRKKRWHNPSAGISLAKLTILCFLPYVKIYEDPLKYKKHYY